MKNKFIHSAAIFLVLLALASCQEDRVRLPPMDKTYSQNDKNPFGSFVLHSHLEQLYFHNSIRNVKKNFESTWRDISDTGALYINISKNLFLSKADIDGMLSYVDAGNSLFIASENIDARLLDSLDCKISTDRFFPEMKYTSVKAAMGLFHDSATYQYFYFPFYSHFTAFDSSNTRVLGNNKAGSNFIVIFYGNGRFYLHIEPSAFSNYFLLQKENYKYFLNAFAFTPAIPEHVYWDDYYNKRNYPGPESGSSSGLGLLLQYPAFAWAFWILLFLFGLYVFFGGKRRQRIIRPIAPNTNTTVTFAETIGRLYLQKKDNRNIADKIIAYFLEHIRSQYFLNTTTINEEFTTTLSRKSNNTKEGTEKLFDLIVVVQQSMDVTDQQLLLLNQQIENFYKKGV